MILSTAVQHVDASQILGNLYIGGRPPIGRSILSASFDVVVFAAEEIQPAEWRVPGPVIIYAPMADVPERLTPAQVEDLRRVGRYVARLLERGRRVLVTCRAGLNRSSLVAATALLESTKMTPMQVIRLIRAKRSPLALNNPAFVHALTTQFRANRLDA